MIYSTRARRFKQYQNDKGRPTRRYPGSDEDCLARTKLKKLGISATATR